MEIMTGGHYSTSGQTKGRGRGSYEDKNHGTVRYPIPDRAFRHELDQCPEHGRRRIQRGWAWHPRYGASSPRRDPGCDPRDPQLTDKPSGPTPRFSSPVRPATNEGSPGGEGARSSFLPREGRLARQGGPRVRGQGGCHRRQPPPCTAARKYGTDALLVTGHEAAAHAAK